MATQPRVFRKNLIDLDINSVSISITDSVATNNGANFVNLMRNRDNESGWSTTDSTDAATTTVVIDMTDVNQFDSILLVGHNLKSYTLKYWDDIGSTWEDFSTVVAPTNNTSTTTLHQFDSVNSSRVQLIINGTMIADDDKTIRQFIITRKLEGGQFIGWPIMKKPQVSLEKKPVSAISGKVKVFEKVGAYAVDLVFKTWPEDADLTLLETMHFGAPKGFLFWPSGGDEDQFKYNRVGYRNQDIYLCAVRSEWQPEWDTHYKSGVNMNVKLVETL